MAKKEKSKIDFYCSVSNVGAINNFKIGGITSEFRPKDARHL